MDRASKIAFIRVKQIEGWTDKEIREHLGYLRGLTSIGKGGLKKIMQIW